MLAPAGAPAARVDTVADIRALRLGAVTGTAAAVAVTSLIRPRTPPALFSTADAARAALQSGQVDALVTDLPAALVDRAASRGRLVLVGQLRQSAAPAQQYRLVLDRDNPLLDCVDQALQALRDDGTLRALDQQWLGERTGVPVLR